MSERGLKAPLSAKSLEAIENGIVALRSAASIARR